MFISLNGTFITIININAMLYFNYLNKKICGLQLPREPHGSTRLLQLTGRWQHDGIM